MLPRVKINFESGALGSVVPSPDGVLALLCTAMAVAGKFDLLKSYVINKFSDLENNLGINNNNNSRMVQHVSDFYKTAPEGTELWLMGFTGTTTMAEMLDVTLVNHAKKLLLAANGRIRILIVAREPDALYTPNVVNGMDSDVWAALLKGQGLAEWATETLFAPVFVVVEGRSFSGNYIELATLSEMSYNRAGVFIGNDHGVADDRTYQSIGLFAGRLASIPVHRNVGRVKDGALPLLKAYIRNEAVEVANISMLHTKGYLTFRTFVGKTGYFFNDDFLATGVADDYRHITARRTIDKAYRIAYLTLLEELLDTIPVNADGSMQAPMAKMWEGKLENAIALQMTANGELSADVSDPKDRGVQAFIDPTQNVISTSKVNVKIRVNPFGYARYIDVYLGFRVVTV